MIERHPSRALGYRGDHPLAWRNFRLEMRSDRAIISPNEPVSVGTHPGRNFGGRTPSMPAAHSIVLAPRAWEKGVGARRNAGGEVDDDIVPGHRAADRIGREEVHVYCSRPHSLELSTFLRRARDRRHPVSRGHQKGNDSTTNHAGRAGDEDSQIRLRI